jgi:hypothetical protein
MLGMLVAALMVRLDARRPDIETGRHFCAQTARGTEQRVSKEDVGGLGAAVDSSLDPGSAPRQFVLSRNVPRRENFAGFTAHIHFVHGQHKRFERLA